MTCRELVDGLADYVADELADDERGRFDRHLAACSDCARYLATYAETIELAKGSFARPDDEDEPDEP